MTMQEPICTSRFKVTLEDRALLWVINPLSAVCAGGELPEQLGWAAKA